MADLSKIILPSGTEYNLKDAAAREAIANINSFDYVVSTDAATTPYGVQWDDDGTTITGTLVASSTTMHKIYLVPLEDEDDNNYFDEYITIQTGTSTYVWEKFGSTKIDLSSLGDLAYEDTASGTVNDYVTGASGSFSGTAATISITPEGSVSAPTISVSSAGSTETIHNPTKATVATAVTTAAPGATAPSNPLTYYSVSGETLSLYQLGYNTGDSITTSDVTVKTSDASYTASSPTFTGTASSASYTPAGDVSVTLTTGSKTITVS